jgi:hypothetical protein
VVASGRDEPVHAARFARLLAGAGVAAAAPEVLRADGDPSAALLDFGERISDPIYVATSMRWTDGRLHWHSTTRRLVQRSTRPVLVVPVRDLSS